MDNRDRIAELVRELQQLLPEGDLRSCVPARAYKWTCPSCGEEHLGHVAEGCARCKAGRDGKSGRPEDAVLVLCPVCLGNGEVKALCDKCRDGHIPTACKYCDGTGIDPVQWGRSAQTHFIEQLTRAMGISVIMAPLTEPPKK